MSEMFIPWVSGTPINEAMSAGDLSCSFHIGFQYNDDYDGNNDYNCAIYDKATTSYWADYTLMPKVAFVEHEHVHNYIMGYCTGCGKAYNAVRVESTSALVGQEIDVTIDATINEGIWSMAFELPIDPDVFEFVSADMSNSIFSQVGVCGFDKTTNSYKFNAYNSSFINNVITGGELVTIKLRVKDDAPEGKYELVLKLNERNIINVDQEKIEFCSEDGAVKVFDQILGDANGDGDISNADALIIFRYIYNPTLYPIPQLLAADVDGDGYVTNADVLEIFRYIYNPVLYPIG
jgi:hypothetical protein